MTRPTPESVPAGGRPPRLLVDLDGILADLVTKWLAAYNRDYGDDLSPSEITRWEWHELVKPACGRRIYHYLNRPGFFRDLRPIPGGVEALRRLSALYEVVVVTASPRAALADKAGWVARHLPFLHPHNLVFTYRKDLVRGEVLFDDAPRNLRRFPGRRLLLDHPYNRDFHGAVRARDWEEAERILAGWAEELRRPPSPSTT